ncbi:MAG TPA: polyhydroxyalkanoate synthesis regulator DNA-binding domain-containing protein [Vicinamibacteria bacterium]
MPGSAAAARRLIRRYDNRKLYDIRERRYVVLGDLARMVGQGDDVRVEDQRTGEDLTAMVMAQVILEGVRERTARIPGQVLARLIRLGFGPRGRRVAWPEPAEAAAQARREAERIVAGLLARGRLTLEEGLALRQEIAGAVQRLVAEAQHGLEARVHRLLDGSDGEVHPSLAGLRERLLSLETQLAEPSVPRRRRAGRASRRRTKER